MKSENSRPMGTRLPELALRRPAVPRWAFSSLALIVAAALSLSALSVAQAAVSGVADSYTAYADTVLTVDAASGVLANDGGDNLTATLDTDPTNGTLVFESDGAFTYTPAAGYVGPDSFRYIVIGDGGRGYVWVTLDVVEGSPPAGDPPADNPFADEPPVDDEVRPPEVEPYLVACEAGSDAALIALCSVAGHAPVAAMEVMKQVIVAHASGLAVLRGHSRP